MTQRKTVLELSRINPDDVKRQSQWFDEQVKNLATKKITPNRLMNENGMNLTQRLMPGKMYFFYYDPKFKETLPYYDQFPLVLPYDKTNDQFIGLNLHYLDYKPRMILFQELLKIAGAKHLTERSKINYSWDMIRNASKVRGVGGCIKRYLISHVQSPFCEIKPEFWHTAIMLPVQRFVGASKEQVWRESIKK